MPLWYINPSTPRKRRRPSRAKAVHAPLVTFGKPKVKVAVKRRRKKAAPKRARRARSVSVSKGRSVTIRINPRSYVNPAYFTKKEERMYEHIKASERKRGRSQKVAKRIAAATTNKYRRKYGLTKNPKQKGRKHMARRRKLSGAALEAHLKKTGRKSAPKRRRRSKARVYYGGPGMALKHQEAKRSRRKARRKTHRRRVHQVSVRRVHAAKTAHRRRRRRSRHSWGVGAAVKFRRIYKRSHLKKNKRRARRLKSFISHHHMRTNPASARGIGNKIVTFLKIAVPAAVAFGGARYLNAKISAHISKELAANPSGTMAKIAPYAPIVGGVVAVAAGALLAAKVKPLQKYMPEIIAGTGLELALAVAAKWGPASLQTYLPTAEYVNTGHDALSEYVNTGLGANMEGEYMASGANEEGEYIATRGNAENGYAMGDSSDVGVDEDLAEYVNTGLGSLTLQALGSRKIQRWNDQTQDDDAALYTGIFAAT